jgi:hypothetical protein
VVLDVDDGYGSLPILMSCWIGCRPFHALGMT